MKTSQYSPEQIAMALRQADAGTPICLTHCSAAGASNASPGPLKREVGRPHVAGVAFAARSGKTQYMPSENPCASTPRA